MVFKVVLTKARIHQVALLFAYLFMLFLIPACTKHDTNHENYRLELSNYLFQYRYQGDSLHYFLDKYTEDGDFVGAMVANRFLGTYYRENAQFTDAMQHHQEGLNLAIKLRDTVEIVRAYNNIGTDYRRLGSHAEASDYHYHALEYAEAYSQVDDLGVGTKNLVVSLNGIGNVSLALGYLEDAERFFRRALEKETALGSHVGQAINYANIGAIYEQREAYDSAHVYYSQSLKNNRLAKSDMGIGLCMIHIGNLYEKEENYHMAKNQYQQAFTLMDSISDRWHWLEACISIARIHLLEYKLSDFKTFIQLAEQTAKEINSPGHLSAIYLLKYEYESQQNQHLNALNNYKLYAAMQDSLRGIHKTNQFMDTRLSYEQNKAMKQLQQVEAENRAKQVLRQYILYITWGVSLIGILFTALLLYAYTQHVRSNKLLREIEKSRTEFFTNITHEFRTPITVISGFNQLLRENKELSDKEVMAYRLAIDRQTNNLLALVNQLLDISKLKSGKDKPQWKRGDVIPFINMLVESFQLYAEGNGVKLIFYSVLESQQMDFIPFYIEKVIGNLLSNAIKYTQSGDKIDCIVAPGPKSETLLIRVVDTGSGIPKEELEHVFEIFYRDNTAMETDIPGSGIGLAFTKMMVEKMKGSITVDSEVNKGTVFTVILPFYNKNLPVMEIFELPVKQETQSEESVEYFDEAMDGELDVNRESNKKSVYQQKQPVVLVVEDNKDVISYLKAILAAKYQLIVARNGEDGLALAEEHLPDIVLADIMVPKKDGTQLCCEMKESPMLNHIPVIMLTAKSSDEDRIKGLRCGAEAYIKKPFDPDELLITIHNILEGRKTLIEKYAAISNNKNHNISKSKESSKLIFLQGVTDIIHAEMQHADLGPAFIAQKLSISLSQLNRKMNIVTGKSTMNYILQVKLNNARKMMQDKNISMAEIANICGFSDQNYFSRMFKKEFGITPTQYQKIPNK